MSESGGKHVFTLTRRSFLKAALATGGVAAFPALTSARGLLDQLGLAAAAGAAPLPGGPYFLSRQYVSPTDKAAHDLWATAQAICARVVPTTTNPLTGQLVSPGGTEAGAVNFIDLFLASFQSDSRPGSYAPALGQKALPVGTSAGDLVTQPPIYLNGRYSGRFSTGNPSTGTPSSAPAEDDFDTAGGAPFVFLALDDTETTAWLLRVYGARPFSGAHPAMSLPFSASATWISQVAGTFTPPAASSTPPVIPGAVALRGYVDGSGTYNEGLYELGLVAFDDWAKQNFLGASFASLRPVEQDALLLLASNPVLGAASSGGLPGLPAPLLNPVPPAAASQLFGVIALHTYQGTYGLPEYAGRSDVGVNGTGAEPTPGTVWASIGWDGDTSPLGNSIYKFGAFNDGYPAYTDPVTGTTQPQGGYVEYRPVSTPGYGDGVLATVEEIVALIDQMVQAGILTVVKGGGL
ncbi:MAG TPA: twin-arginine translocation signal domain-containing protein [Acidimicrobiales bacterium]|nr:twin-arginine translocation signal domain-containing protein [Acidimicrobiales bacterium]